MSLTKSALIAGLTVAVALGSSLTAASAHSNKKAVRNFVYGAAATAVVVSVVKKDCKKWKHRYNATGNPYYLDRYYDCI
jgi:hypothetical protein